MTSTTFGYSEVALDDSHVYVAVRETPAVGGNGSLIYRVEKNGGGYQVLFTSDDYNPNYLALSTTRVFWLSARPGLREGIRWANKDGGNPNLEAIQGSDTVPSVHATAQTVYWTQRGATSGVRRMNLSGLPDAVDVLVDRENPSWIAVDGDYIFFSDDIDEVETLFRVAVDGTGLTVIGSAADGSFTSLMALEVNDDGIYWLDRLNSDVTELVRADFDGDNISILAGGEEVEVFSVNNSQAFFLIGPQIYRLAI